jgi:dehydrogenase/reductase SDR family member 1
LTGAPLEGQVAVVIGASRGIGKGIAYELAMAGAFVYAAGRTLDDGVRPGSLRNTASEIEQADGSCEPVRCDATNDAQVAALIEQVGSDRGRLDILVNSAFDANAFSSTIGYKFWELPIDVWHSVVDVGTRSAYVAATYAAPLLLAGDRGLIVNVSGRGASRYRYNTAYGVGKAALDKMTADMAQELRPHSVAVVSLWPNVTKTEDHGPISQSLADRLAVYGHKDVLETPRYSGRAVVALANDPNVLEKSGHHKWVAELAAEYGFTDEFGDPHPLPS